MEPPRDLTEAEKACVKAQLDAYYSQKPDVGPGCTPDTNLKASGAAGKVNDDYEAYKTAMSHTTY